MSRTRETAFMAVICLSQVFAQAGIGQTLPILRHIGNTFGIADSTNLSWAIAGYCMVVGTLILVAGRLGDVFGHKSVFLWGFVWSSVWSGVVGASFYSTKTVFIIARALQGVGIALVLPNALALLAAVYRPGIRKAVMFTLYAAMAPIGLIGGAAVASALTMAWWPLTYWAYSLMLVLVGGFGVFVIPGPAHKSAWPSSAYEAMVDLDIPGILTGISSLVLIGYSWNQASLVGWQQQPYVWVALIFGVLLGLLFLLIETYYAFSPLLPFRDLPGRVSWVFVEIACGFSCFGVWVFYTWQVVEGFRHATPLQTTAYFTPIVAVGCVASMTIGLSMNRIGPSLMMGISLLTLGAGPALVGTMPLQQTYWAQLFASTVAVGWGMSTSIPAAVLLISDMVDKSHHGTMANLLTTVVYCSVAIGLGVAGTVVNNVDGGRRDSQITLEGFRVAQWCSVGFAGFAISIWLMLRLSWDDG
ncbi:major facilitator superfamily-domain-containing protein [Xylariomycetidae sp. FL0641]|nr:major facilitator superfamily-domain-containing protein [Xylariomycetidae sp. FL0641]